VHDYCIFSGMWSDFQSGGTKVSYEMYRRIFDNEHITIGQPPQDECETCLSYKFHTSEQCSDSHDETCVICISAKDHLERARKARHEYQNIDPNAKTFAVDMQKVILLPKLTFKQHFFVSRLVVFNETFACLNEGQDDLVILWHEAISGRNAADVASAYVKCLEFCSSGENVVFWCDNCCGQNKNWTLFCTLLLCVNSEWGPNEVTIKYLEKGHTFLKADSIHANIGKKMRKQSEVVNFQDFVDLCFAARKTIKPVVLQVNDFYNFKPSQRTRKTKNGPTLPILSSICAVLFKKSSPNMFYKTDFSGEFVEVNFTKSTFNLSAFPSTRESPRGIPQSKKESILKLLESVTPAKKKFWTELPTNDTVTDLVDNLE
jgi:hypothetical protein